ncbi:MAG TPA: hypothetical protein VJA87_00420 [Candidatus Paceibacterota bacterium]
MGIEMCGVGEEVLTKTAVVKLGRALCDDLKEVATSSEGIDLLKTLKMLHLRFAVAVGERGRGAIGAKRPRLSPSNP